MKNMLNLIFLSKTLFFYELAISHRKHTIPRLLTNSVLKKTLKLVYTVSSIAVLFLFGFSCWDCWPTRHCILPIVAQKVHGETFQKEILKFSVYC